MLPLIHESVVKQSVHCACCYLGCSDEVRDTLGYNIDRPRGPSSISIAEVVVRFFVYI